MRPVTEAMLPKVDVLTLATIMAVPPEHPEHATFSPFPVHGGLSTMEMARSCSTPVSGLVTPTSTSTTGRARCCLPVRLRAWA